MPDQLPEPTPEGSPLSLRLREDTASAHRRLDRQPALARLAGPGLSRAQYRDSLLGLYRAWDPLEHWLEQALADSADEAAEFFLPRRHALRADLVALADGLSTVGEVRRLPVPATLRAGSPAHRIGCLYVLAGAQMGATLLDRAVSAHLPAAPRGFLGTRFEDAGPRWQRFRRFLDRRFTEPDDENAVVAAANSTFGAFMMALD